MADPLLLKFYRKLPQPGTPITEHAAQIHQALREFREAIVGHYSEGTLARLLGHASMEVRRAAILGLGLIGTLASNRAVAKALRDQDAQVRRFAHDALWELWLRGADAEQGWSLRQVMQLPDETDRLSALNALIVAAPDFAEARHQRALMLFRRSDYRRCARDCRAALKLNPLHFAAAAALGQCYLKLKRPHAALHAFERALKIHPNLIDLQDAVKTLQEVLGK